MPAIDRMNAKPFYLQLYEQIVEGIESGLYPAGKRLPSIRESARELEVSNTTIELAYQRLVEEGYAQAKRGSGYTICATAKPEVDPTFRFSTQYRSELDQLAQGASAADSTPIRFDFAYDAADRSLFPFTTWARISRDVFFGSEADGACMYNNSQGLLKLREQIATYIGKEYGVHALADQILIMPTTRLLIDEIIGLFDAQSTVVGMEEPGYNEVAKTLRNRNYAVKNIPLSPGLTWEAAVPYLDGVNLVFCTPASQFPTNSTMPRNCREKLLEWAERTNAYIIDDEYGWEFQSGSARIPSLGTMDKTGRVITLGTFSNAFTPAICLSYAVLPPALMLKWKENEQSHHPLVPWQTQAAMGTFMEEGHWKTHIRRVRTAMLRKRTIIADALQQRFGARAEVVVGQSSLFVLVRVESDASEAELIERAAAKGVRVYPTSCYFDGEAPADWRYILVGFAGISLQDIAAGVAALAEAWL